jgi:hypothetical protein
MDLANQSAAMPRIVDRVFLFQYPVVIPEEEIPAQQLDLPSVANNVYAVVG